MIQHASHSIEVVIYEGKGASQWDSGRRLDVTTRLLEKGFSTRRVTLDSASAKLPPAPDLSLIVLGDFVEAAPEIIDADGIREITTKNTSGSSADQILEIIDEIQSKRETSPNAPGTQGSWKPWFPVIDYDRCTNCMQCLSFCLFDVYGVDSDNRIQVQNNDNCKTNCPACSRVCPEVAIMFPKYGTGPINGEPVNQKDVERESMKVDITALLGGDIYSSLRTRSEQAKSRFSKERSPDKALNERKRCMVKLQQSGIIPPEVLASLDLESLPSPEEIQKKAEQLAAMQSGEEA